MKKSKSNVFKKYKSNVFKKSKKRTKNKNKRRQTNKKYRPIMYGGAYDRYGFIFPDSLIFRGSSIIKFRSVGAPTYYISKNPDKLLKIPDPHPTFKPMLSALIEKVEHMKIIDVTLRLSGMFFLYGIDEVSYGRPRYYGLFYLLTRIELLAVLLQSKKNPKFQDNFKDVNFPINDSSILPGDYNNYPWGYLYLFDRTDRNHDQILLSFINFSEKLGQVKTKLLEFAPSAAPSEELQIQQQQEIIGEIELPTSSSIKLMRMLPKIEIYTPPGEESRFVDLYKG